MLYRPASDPSPARFATLLESWNDEADRFRLAATAARRGDAPPEAIVTAARDAEAGLDAVIGEIDAMLIDLPAGDARFSALLGAQTMALALYESIRTSREGLEACASRPVAEARRISHGASFADGAR